jgi:hypothetical protein
MYRQSSISQRPLGVTCTQQLKPQQIGCIERTAEVRTCKHSVCNAHTATSGATAEPLGGLPEGASRKLREAPIAIRQPSRGLRPGGSGAQGGSLELSAGLPGASGRGGFGGAREAPQSYPPAVPGRLGAFRKPGAGVFLLFS